jgi:rare lipoprotein A
MYVPAPPAPPAGGWDPVGINSAALGPALPNARSLATTITAPTTTTSLAVRSSTLNVLERHPVTVTGKLSAHHAVAGLAGRMVSLQAFSGGGWSTVAIARTRGAGIFRLRFTPRRLGSRRLRVRFAGEGYLLRATRRLGRLNVYRSVEASWYGGGGALACGGSLTTGTMGVASRTLPCGTRVTLRFNGRSVRVPVVDRGPFIAGREFDLTEATKQALGFGDTGALWSTS